MVGRPRSFDVEHVLAQAMHVFWTKGYDGAGITDLETATGLGRQSLYGAFGDKRALFLRVVDFYFAHVLEPGFVAVLDAPGSGRANIERIFAGWQAVASAPDFHGCLVGNTATHMKAHDDAIADVLRRKLRLLEDAFARALSRGIEDGEIRADIDPRTTARALLTFAQGLSVIAQVNKDPAFVAHIVDAARRLLD